MNVRSINLYHPKVNITRCSIAGILLYLAQMNVTICISRKTFLLFIISSIRESPKHEAYLTDSGTCIIRIMTEREPCLSLSDSCMKLCP